MVPIARQQRDHARREEMEVEFIGGPFDGTRLRLDVVRDTKTQIRVLEKGYTQTFTLPTASEVEAESNA